MTGLSEPQFENEQWCNVPTLKFATKTFKITQIVYGNKAMGQKNVFNNFGTMGAYMHLQKGIQNLFWIPLKK